ncbi:MAG TPA: flavodoxin domain-containing protein [Actinomycetota bacterium]|nr:flavodoxin domain-containing protein [Actinomycetota bacterium]
MTRTKVLVACASKMGSTAGIADAIAARLREAGLEVERTDAGRVQSLEGYDAVVLGSAVYLGRWRATAVRFLHRFRSELGRRPTWLFQSGPLDDSAERTPPALPGRIAARAERIGCRGFVTFGGCIDPDHAEGFAARRMVDAGLAKDYRDFDRVRAWADAIATELGSCAPAA